MIGESSPVSGTDAFARRLADYERRIAELERRGAYAGPGSVLWQHNEIASFSSSMNESEDLAYSDDGGTYPFATVAVMEVSALYMSPDRSTRLGAQIYSNSYASPSSGGLIYTGQSTIVTSAGSGWTYVGAIPPAVQPIAASTGGLTWTLRLFGVLGGPTNYDARYNVLLQRIAA